MPSLKVAADRAFVMPEGISGATVSPSLTTGQALPNYLLEDPQEYQLVDFRTVLAALAVPEYAKDNRSHIWPVDLDDYLPDKIKKAAAQDKIMAEVMNMVKGRSSIGFDLVGLAAADEMQNPMYLYVIDDKILKRMMVVGPQQIAKTLESDLRANGVQYVVKGDAGSVQQINEFLAEGARHRGMIGKLKMGNTQNVIESLIKAFSAICEVSGDPAICGVSAAGEDQFLVRTGLTVGAIIHESTSKPGVFTRIVKPKAP